MLNDMWLQIRQNKNCHMHFYKEIAKIKHHKNKALYGILIFFSYREMAIKFNDYFEFPKEFDLSPYTAAGLAEIEGNVHELYSTLIHTHCVQ